MGRGRALPARPSPRRESGERDGDVLEATGERLRVGQRAAVRGLGPDGSTRWSFAAEPLSDDGEAIVLLVRAGEPVEGPDPWTWPADGRHHFWRGRHYSILVTRRAARFPYWHATVHTPPIVRDGELVVTDLGLSVQLFADGRYAVGGEDELAAHDLPSDPALRDAARAAVAEIVDLIRRKAPPFSNAELGARNAE